MFQNDSMFGRFMNLLWDILLTGIMCVTGCLPIVTAGAAVTAGYYTMAKSVRRKTGYTWKEFLHSFKGNLKQSVLLTVGLLAVLVVLILDMMYVWENDTKLNSAVFMVLIFVVFLVAGIGIYIWPLLSRFEKKNLELIKMAMVVMFKYLPVTIGLILLFAVSCIGIYLMPWAILVIPGVYLYILTFPMEWILKKLMPVPEEGSEEAEKWYYQ